MSALARLLHERGVQVTGSDDVSAPVLDELRRLGMRVWSGPSLDCAPMGRGCVVRSAAVSAQHPEVSACEREGYESILYSEALGRLTAQCKTLAVAGTHGKTTTAALLTAAMRGGGIDCSHVVGGDIPQLGGSGRAGTSPWLVTEACEFDRSFLRLHPSGAALLNFDHDHFDCYPQHVDLLRAHAEFASRVPEAGLLVFPADVPPLVTSRIAAGREVRRVGFGLPAEHHPVDVRHDLGRYSFVPVVFGRLLPRISLQLPGLFQIHNALCALTLAVWAGAEVEGACRGISMFRGVRRRFEVRTGPGGGELIHDYAHHPVEIDAVLTAVRQRYPGRRHVVVFQPHQHQRTRALFEAFAEALARADVCLLADIYGARETAEQRASVSARDLAAAVRDRGGDGRAVGGLAAVPAAVREVHRAGDVVSVLGAGDIDAVLDRVTEIV